MRRIGALFVVLVLVAACSTGGPGQTPVPGATNPGQATSAGGGAGVLEAATAAAAHPCSLMPMDLVAIIVPSPPPPTEQLFPPTCSVYGEKVAIAFSISISPFTVPEGSQEISGLSQKAYLEKLTAGNWTLWVRLSPETGHMLVEVNNQDGKDHQDEVVSLAKSILAKLGG